MNTISEEINAIKFLLKSHYVYEDDSSRKKAIQVENNSQVFSYCHLGLSALQDLLHEKEKTRDNIVEQYRCDPEIEKHRLDIELEREKLSIQQGDTSKYQQDLEEVQRSLNSLLKLANPKKLLIEFDASSVSGLWKGKHKSAEMLLTNFQTKILSYNNSGKSELILSQVFEFANNMQKEYVCTVDDTQSRKKSQGKLYNDRKLIGKEIQVVQPAMKIFLSNTKSCFLREENMKIVQEKYFVLTEEDNDNIFNVTGKSDHTFNYLDAGVVVVEDKTFGLSLTEKEISQLRCAMEYEVEFIITHYHIDPERYCGILHNTQSWIFVYRLHTKGLIEWQYVKLLPLYDDENIFVDNCRTLTKFIEDAYVVADNIIEMVHTPVVPITSLIAVNDDEEEEEEERDDDIDGDGDHNDVDDNNHFDDVSDGEHNINNDNQKDGEHDDNAIDDDVNAVDDDDNVVNDDDNAIDDDDNVVDDDDNAVDDDDKAIDDDINGLDNYFKDKKMIIQRLKEIKLPQDCYQKSYNYLNSKSLLTIENVNRLPIQAYRVLK